MRVTETSVKIFCIFDDVIMTSIWAFPNFWHSELISLKHDLQDLWSNNLIALLDPEIWASKDAWKSPKKRLSIYHGAGKRDREFYSFHTHSISTS